MSVQANIIQGFQNAVKDAVAASTKPLLPIKFIGLAFSVPNDQKYLEIVHIPNAPAFEAWGEERLEQGAFRLILHWPVGAPYEPVRLLEQITGHFQKDRRFSGFKVGGVPTFGGTLENGTENLYPATVRYQQFT